jgi:L-lactate dehydrogenase complex protein LldG
MRDRVLGSIRKALAAQPSDAVLPPPWSGARADATQEALVRTFTVEVSALGGEVFVVPDRLSCAAAIEGYAGAHQVNSVALQSSPLALDVGAGVRNLSTATAAGMSTAELERVDAAVIEARALLADTGSALVLTSGSRDRLLPYLPRTCMVIALASRLCPTMSQTAMAALEEAARQGFRGEALFVTGPSRTADIEKTLVLGAHGPAALVVFIIGEPAKERPLPGGC